jgi:uncharacterized protein
LFQQIDFSAKNTINEPPNAPVGASVNPTGDSMPVPASLLEILACPKCKGKLEQTDSPEGFGCRACGLLYKTEDEIPNFLIDEALPWDPASN